MSRRHLIIPDTDGLYSCDQDGNIYSNGRSQTITNRWGGTTERYLKGRKLLTYLSSGGYLMVDLSLLTRKKKCLVHRLVALTFLDNPDNLSEVNHINSQKTDNRVENLEWCTRRYNINDNILKKGHGGPYGKQKLSIMDRREMVLTANRIGSTRASRMFNVCYGYCQRLLREYRNG